MNCQEEEKEPEKYPDVLNFFDEEKERMRKANLLNLESQSSKRYREHEIFNYREGGLDDIERRAYYYQMLENGEETAEQREKRVRESSILLCRHRVDEFKWKYPGKTYEELFYNTSLWISGNYTFDRIVYDCIKYGVKPPIAFTLKFEDLEKEFLAFDKIIRPNGGNPWFRLGLTPEDKVVIGHWSDMLNAYVSRIKLRKATGILEY